MPEALDVGAAGVEEVDFEELVRVTSVVGAMMTDDGVNEVGTGAGEDGGVMMEIADDEEVATVEGSETTADEGMIAAEDDTTGAMVEVGTSAVEDVAITAVDAAALVELAELTTGDDPSPPIVKSMQDSYVWSIEAAFQYH